MKLWNTVMRAVLSVVVAGLVLTTSGVPSSAISESLAEVPDPPHSVTQLQPILFLPLVSRGSSLPVFGVITYWPLKNGNGLDEIQAMNAQWVRAAFSWNSVEPVDTTPDYFNWSAWDTEASNAASAGVSLIATVHGNPSWAAEYPGGPLYPDHVADFVELMQAAAERYDGDGYSDAPGSPVIRLGGKRIFRNRSQNTPLPRRVATAVRCNWGFLPEPF